MRTANYIPSSKTYPIFSLPWYRRLTVFGWFAMLSLFAACVAGGLMLVNYVWGLGWVLPTSLAPAKPLAIPQTAGPDPASAPPLAVPTATLATTVGLTATLVPTQIPAQAATPAPDTRFLITTTEILEALTGLGNNGHMLMGTPDDEEGADTFYAAMKVYDAVEVPADGLGPVYNAQACRECHQVPMSGGSSQISVIRAGSKNATGFVEHPGGSLIQDRAIHPSLQESVLTGNDIVALRLSLSILGDGFVEAVPDETFKKIAQAQPLGMRGEVILVEVLEAPGTKRVGRFGWKNQHASLLSFSADAYLNEMGITSPLLPTENTANGKNIAAFDAIADPEEEATDVFPAGTDVHAFADFMRALKAPARDTVLAAQPEAIEGQALFQQIGCEVCHTDQLVTAPAGTLLNGGVYSVTAALGSKRIRPYGDYLMHNIGTGDGIYQAGPATTVNMIRTAPLWGLHSRNRFMHDGQSFTVLDAIRRHQGQAVAVRTRFDQLTPVQKQKVLLFLSSL